MLATKPLLLSILFVFASCATHTIRVPVLVPAPVNLVQYDVVAVDRFHGDGSDPFSDEIAEALGNAVNPMTGKRGFEVLHRKDIDRALDQIRDRRGTEWDERTMAILDRWRKAPIVVKGTMHHHAVDRQVVDVRSRDQQGRTTTRSKEIHIAHVEVLIEATDVEGNRQFDAVTLQGSAAVEHWLGAEKPPIVDPTPLLAAARSEVVHHYLQRVLPHQTWVAVDLYKDGDFPDLQVGNGFAEVGNWEAAGEAYQRALQQMTGEFAEYRYMALFNLGVAYEFTDRFAEAKKTLEEAYAIGQDQRILHELGRNAAREQEVRRLREQSAAPQR
jgi:hypothetical protein